MIEMDQAWKIIFDKTKEIANQKADNTCLKDIDQIKPGDILAENVYAADDLPPFRASVMDGYAISSVDQESYIVISYKSLAGTDPATSIDLVADKPYAIYVTTGAPVPDGCNTVVPIENIEKLDHYRIKIQGEMKEGQFIRQPGSDIGKG